MQGLEHGRCTVCWEDALVLASPGKKLFPLSHLLPLLYVRWRRDLGEGEMEKPSPDLPAPAGAGLCQHSCPVFAFWREWQTDSSINSTGLAILRCRLHDLCMWWFDPGWVPGTHQSRLLAPLFSGTGENEAEKKENSQARIKAV